MTKRPIPGSDPVPTPLARPGRDAPMAEAEADPAAVRTLRCRAVARGRFTQIDDVRHLPPQPVPDGEPDGPLSGDIAPNASEAPLAAFGIGRAVGVHAQAVARNVPVRRLGSDPEADIDTTAVWRTGDIEPMPRGLEAVRVPVRIDVDAFTDSLKASIRHARLRSPVANRLHDPVHPDVNPAAATSEEAA